MLFFVASAVSPAPSLYCCELWILRCSCSRSQLNFQRCIFKYSILLDQSARKWEELRGPQNLAGLQWLLTPAPSPRRTARSIAHLTAFRAIIPRPGISDPSHKCYEMSSACHQCRPYLTTRQPGEHSLIIAYAHLQRELGVEGKEGRGPQFC